MRGKTNPQAERAQPDRAAEEASRMQSPEMQRRKKLRKRIEAALWCVTIVLYLLLSFYSGKWYITWVIFLVAAAVENIVRACFDLNDKEKTFMNRSAVARIILWSVIAIVLAGFLFAALAFDGMEDFLGRLGLGWTSFRYDETGYSIGNFTTESEITSIKITGPAEKLIFPYAAETSCWQRKPPIMKSVRTKRCVI